MTLCGGDIVFVFGGARSGKSAYAEELARASGLECHYVATAAAGDIEMTSRITAHRARRGPDWTTHEEQIELALILASISKPGTVVLIDCLTLWLSNLMALERDIEAESAVLTGALAAAQGAIILVSNEVGGGVVPDNPLARRFADAQGRLNQHMASVADKVVLVASGLPLIFKNNGRLVHG